MSTERPTDPRQEAKQPPPPENAVQPDWPADPMEDASSAADGSPAENQPETLELPSAAASEDALQFQSVFRDAESATRPSDPDKPSPDLEPRRLQIPGYEIVRELGRGGMGVVYEARHLRLNRVVALKMVLAGSHAGSGQLARFLQEAEAVAALQHPNIVQVYELGQHQGLPFMSLEYVAGGSLHNHLDGTPLPPRRAARLVEQLAGGMQAAHDKGIVHRDLKPGNVLLADARVASTEITDDDVLPATHHALLTAHQPKITDFGLAKRVEGGSGLTQTGAIMGTPSYMAPEQASGDGQRVGPAADIYALGAILYECLTGRPPFKAATPMDTMLQVVSNDPAPPSQLQPGLPRDLETICLMCLRKEPDKRYASAAALAEDLRRFMNDEPILARRAGRIERTWRWCRRNPVVAAMTGAVVALLALIAIGSFVAAVQLNAERLAAQTNEKSAKESAAQANENLDRALSAEQEKTEKLWQSYLAQAQAGRWSGKAGRRFHSLEALTEAARIRPSQQLRNEAIACMPLVDVETLKEWPSTDRWTVRTAFDPPFEKYARMDSDGNIGIFRVADDKELLRLPGFHLGGGPGSQCWFSPDGQYLAVRHHKNTGTWFVLWDLQRKKSILKMRNTTVSTAFDFSPDSRWLALNYLQGGIRLYDLKAGKVLQSFAVPPNCSRIQVDPSGRFLAVANTNRNQILIWDVQNQRFRPALTCPDYSGGVHALAWHPEGKRLAGGAADGRVFVWDLEKSKQSVVQTLTAHSARVYSISFSHDGQTMVTASWDRSSRFWNLSTGEEQLKVTGEYRNFSRDDDLLAYFVGEARFGICRVALAEECRVAQLSPGQRVISGGVAFSPDGRLLATASNDGLRLWHADSREMLEFFPVGFCSSAHWPEHERELITTGASGLLRWPVQREHKNGKLLRQIGPPRRISLNLPEKGATFGRSSLTADSQTLAVIAGWQALSVSLQEPIQRTVLGNHANMDYIAMSPDGKWCATGAWQGKDINIWDVSQRKLVRSLPGLTMRSGFSPDGKWLVTSTAEEYGFWETGSWRLRHRVERRHEGNVAGPMAFSRDGKLTAIAWSFSVIQLIETGTGREIATLEPVQPKLINSLCFSPDGSRLAVAAEEHLQIWDLCKIRKELSPLGLDWDLPPFPAKADLPVAPPAVVKGLPWEMPPQIVALPPLRRHRDATPEQLAKWIDNLGSNEEKIRRQAATSLAEAGPAALELLAKAAHHKDPVHARRLTQLSNDIRLRQILSPPLIQLQFNNAPLPEAVKELAQHIGINLLYDSAAEAQPKSITLKLDGLSPWEALERFCQEAELTWDSSKGSGKQTVRLRNGRLAKHGWFADAGPFRLEIDKVNFHSGIMLRDKTKLEPKNWYLNIRLRSFADDLLAVARPHIAAALDENGRPLPTHPSSPNPFIQVMPPGNELLFALSLPASEPKTEKLKSLKIGLPVEAWLPEETLLQITDIAKAENKIFVSEIGPRLTIQKVTNQPLSRNTLISLAITGKNDWQYDPKQHRFELRDQHGRPYALPSPYLTQRPLHEPRGEHLALIGGIASLSAPPAHAPWAAQVLTARRKVSSQWIGTLRFPFPADRSQPRTLTLSRGKMIRTELIFELGDIPLP